MAKIERVWVERDTAGDIKGYVGERCVVCCWRQPGGRKFNLHDIVKGGEPRLLGISTRSAFTEAFILSMHYSLGIDQ